MKVRTRIKGEERRVAIIEAVLPVFAEKGLRGATTKDLARAAGVSEALLFKHFKDKEALYAALSERRWELPVVIEGMRRLKEMPPSSEKVFFGVHGWTRIILFGGEGTGYTTPFSRLLLQSLVGDGEYARGAWRTTFERAFAEYKAAYQAARRAGDLEGDWIGDEAAFWLPHHAAFLAKFGSLSGRTVVNYGMPLTKFHHKLTLFCLRGIGFKESVLRARYKPEELDEGGWWR